LLFIFWHPLFLWFNFIIPLLSSGEFFLGDRLKFFLTVWTQIGNFAPLLYARKIEYMCATVQYTLISCYCLQTYLLQLQRVIQSPVSD
jgi:hypothetical protein